MNVYKNCFSYYFNIKNSYNLTKNMGYQIIKLYFIKINPKLKFFEIIVTFY